MCVVISCGHKLPGPDIICSHSHVFSSAVGYKSLRVSSSPLLQKNNPQQALPLHHQKHDANQCVVNVNMFPVLTLSPPLAWHSDAAWRSQNNICQRQHSRSHGPSEGLTLDTDTLTPAQQWHTCEPCSPRGLRCLACVGPSQGGGEEEDGLGSVSSRDQTVTWNSLMPGRLGKQWRTQA